MENVIRSNKKFVFVMGPTSAGKSAWALYQALKYNGAIVNCDSVQVYRELDIGSSKPSKEEMAKVPHYLFDYVSYPQEMTAGQYSRDFFSTIDKIEQQLVFVVGGTGFYFQALEKGMYPVRTISKECKDQVEADLKVKGFNVIYDWIRTQDPLYAQKISVNDKYRIERAYELMLSEKKTITQIQEEFSQKTPAFPYRYLKIGITGTKEELLPLVEQRTEKMLESGLLQEVKILLERGYKGWGPLDSVGYKEAVKCIENELGLLWLKAEIIKNTMKLIKKQRTWFQRDKLIVNHHRLQLEISELDSFIKDSGY